MPTKKSAVEQMIDKADGEAVVSEAMEGDEQQQEAQPIFKKYPEARIPISKSAGALWKSRYETAEAKIKSTGIHEAWDETVTYYKNDQTNKRTRDNPDAPGSTSAKDAMHDGEFSNTENVVFSNVSALVPSIYAKNPDVTVQSAKGDAERKFSLCAQKLIRTILQKRTSPGVNLKPKMRKGVVRTALMNVAYLEVGYTRREVSSAEALQEIDNIAAQLAEKDLPKKKIEELEGQLAALDETVDLLQPPGPWVRLVHGKDVRIDPDVEFHHDAKWIMIRDVMETSVLNAIYRSKIPESDQYKSIYEPTHVLKATHGNTNIAGHDEEITNFSLLKGAENDHSAFGFSDDRTFKRAQRTYVWRVWDRITRRVYMYAEHDWTWPIWVWDDPYGLDEFFPIFPMEFHTDPEDLYAKGEVSYYLDQQDDINLINSQIARMRFRVASMMLYNGRAVKDESDVLPLVEPAKGKRLVKVNVEEGFKISDVIAPPPVPTAEMQTLFDKRSSYDAVDRLSGVPSVVKGAEYKTNTTNKAIESYESSSATRLDEKIDAIEDIVGRIGNAILVMCLQFMPKEQVIELIGPENAEAWPPPMDAKSAQRSFSLTVTGGSSMKPTSKVRKQQAEMLGQMLGQFGASQPVAFYILLKVFQRAFSDELVLDDRDWDMIIQAVEGQIQQSMQPQGGEGGGEIQNPEELLAQVDEMLQKLPDRVRSKVGQEIAKGVPLADIMGKVQEVMQAAQASKSGAQPQPQQPPR